MHWSSHKKEMVSNVISSAIEPVCHQAGYEALVADTNASIADLTKQITSKTQARAQAKKDSARTQGDLADTTSDLENLGKYNADLHGMGSTFHSF